MSLNHLYGPDNLPVTRVVDHTNSSEVASPAVENDVKENDKNEDLPLEQSLFPDSPKAQKADDLPTALFAEFELKLDLHYGIQYVLYDGKKSIADIALTYDIKQTDLMVWNGLLPGETPDLGMMIYLTKPSRATFHVARFGESLASIAARHSMSELKIIKLNRLERVFL